MKEEPTKNKKKKKMMLNLNNETIYDYDKSVSMRLCLISLSVFSICAAQAGINDNEINMYSYAFKALRTPNNNTCSATIKIVASTFYSFTLSRFFILV